MRFIMWRAIHYRPVDQATSQVAQLRSGARGLLPATYLDIGLLIRLTPT